MRRALAIGLVSAAALGVIVPQRSLEAAEGRARIETIGATRRFTARTLRVTAGDATGGLGALATRDQRGDDDDPAAYLRLASAGGRFDARLNYRVPRLASAATVDVVVSIRSSAGWWRLQVRDPAAGRWVGLLGQADVAADGWEWRRVALDADWVGGNGRVRLRVVGNGGPLDLDYLAVRRTVWQPAPGTTWQWQLTGEIDTSFDVEMYDVDLFDVRRAVIDGLHADGRVVVCYFSAGSWERWRPDAAAFGHELRGEPLDGWPGERWLDIRRLDMLRPIMVARLDLAVAKGCDGVEPDNVDGYTNDSGFALDAADQLAYNRWLAAAAHRRGLSVGLKNDLDQVGGLLDRFDWALNEECFAYRECEKLDPFVAAGKAVFGVEYTGRPKDFCPAARGRGFSWLKKRLNLGAWTRAC